MRALEDRRALVNGAARGIEEAIAERLAEEGARVAVSDVALADAGQPRSGSAGVPLRPVPPDMGQDTTRAWTALRRIRGAILRLREIGTLRELLDATPAAVCRVGFDRAMVSRVEDSTWVVERFHSESDAAWAAEINELALRTPQRLSPSLLETCMLRRRAPILVRGAQQDARVSRPLAEATLSSSYVAAPIMPDGRVIGFLHADRYDHGVEVDQFDLEVLSCFAEQLGQVLERTLLLERLDGLRRRVGTLTEALNGTVNDCRHAPINMSPDGAQSPAALIAPLRAASTGFRKPTVTPDQVLTPREREVLQLMACGDTNARIATRLVVSEGTVKTHVKHILHKLAATNRAEAVCRWLQHPALVGERPAPADRRQVPEV